MSRGEDDAHENEDKFLPWWPKSEGRRSWAGEQARAHGPASWAVRERSGLQGEGSWDGGWLLARGGEEK